MYAVVEFLGSDDDESSNEIAVVPLIWLTKQEKRCYWPNRIGKVNFDDFVKQNTPYKSTWPTYKIYKVHLKTENYDEAERFLDQFIKDISDGQETAESSKSIRKKLLCLSKQNALIDATDAVSVPPSSPSTVALASQSNVSAGSLLASTLTAVTSSNNSSPSSSSVSRSVEETVISEIVKIQSVVEQQTLLLNEILRNTRTQMTAALGPVAPSDLPKFPLKEFEEFTNFETRLKGDDSFHKYMVSRLSSVEGSGLEALTRRVLKFLILDEVAAGFNWKGRGDKRPFAETTTMSVIREAVKAYFPANERSDLLVNNTVKDWLKYATSRLKNRKTI